MTEFPMAPAESRYLWFIIPITALLLGVMALLFATVLGSRSARFEISDEGLRLRGDMYGRLIPWSELRVDEARRVDFSEERGLRPNWRTMGTALPGYQAGWFRLGNRQKALLYLTDRSKAVYIPTEKGYSLLLSPSDPDAFLERLRRGS